MNYGVDPFIRINLEFLTTISVTPALIRSLVICIKIFVGTAIQFKSKSLRN